MIVCVVLQPTHSVVSLLEIRHVIARVLLIVYFSHMVVVSIGVRGLFVVVCVTGTAIRKKVYCNINTIEILCSCYVCMYSVIYTIENFAHVIMFGSLILKFRFVLSYFIHL